MMRFAEVLEKHCQADCISIIIRNSRRLQRLSISMISSSILAILSFVRHVDICPPTKKGKAW